MKKRLNFEMKIQKSEAETWGMRLIPVNETFCVADGKYEAEIADAFEYSGNKAMIKFKLQNGKIFLKSETLESIQSYPYSRLLTESGREYVADLKGLKVAIEVVNATSKTTGTEFSNIRRINLVQ